MRQATESNCTFFWPQNCQVQIASDWSNSKLPDFNQSEGLENMSYVLPKANWLLRANALSAGSAFCFGQWLRINSQETTA